MIVFFPSVSWFAGQTFQRGALTPVHAFNSSDSSLVFVNNMNSIYLPHKTEGFLLNSLLEGDTGWELSLGTFELFFKGAGHSS